MRSYTIHPIATKLYATNATKADKVLCVPNTHTRMVENGKNWASTQDVKYSEMLVVSK